MTRETERHPGRPFLDGSSAGKGTRTVTKCVSIPQEMAEYLKILGGGNLSKGVRIVTECYQENKLDTLRSTLLDGFK